MFRKILFPVDLSEPSASEDALQVAIQEARNHGAKLHVMSVLPGFGLPWVATYFPRDALEQARKSLEQRLQQYVREKIPDELQATAVVREGTPYREILEEVGRVSADLVVIQCQDASELGRAVLGSCASRVVEHAHISVMVIRRPRG